MADPLPPDDYSGRWVLPDTPDTWLPPPPPPVYPPPPPPYPPQPWSHPWQPGGWDPYPPLPPPRRSGPAVVVVGVAVAAVLTLLISAFVVLWVNRADEAASEATQEQIDEAVAESTVFVEQQRGLMFLEPVTVELARGPEFGSGFEEGFDEQRHLIEQSEAVLTAIGVIEADFDLVSAMEDQAGAGVAGYYDAETNELVVRGSAVTPFVRSVIVHELTHALDDQHFELYRPQLVDVSGEEAFGFAALVEGNATRIEQAYVGTLSPAERDELRQEEAGLAFGFGFVPPPTVLIELGAGPYVLGPQLVSTILRHGGQVALDAAFATPPVTSEQVLDPERFVNGEGIVPVPVPEADGEVFDQGVLGALLLEHMLQESVFSGDASVAARGWGGDSYVAWHDGDRACVRASFVGDTEGDTTEMLQALEKWGAATGGDVRGGMFGPVTIMRCA